MASERTEALLAELANVELFRSAGTPEDAPPATARVSSWKEALASKRVKAFENVKLEARGDLTARLSNEHPARHARWNEITRELRQRVIATFEASCRAYAAKHGLGEELWSSTRWDILGACMECEYADIVPATFYGNLAKVYLAGHFPCGWSGGLYPAGQLEIY
jgi:hypothetical protein